MRVAIISPEYPPHTNLGGIATFNQNLSRLLSQMNNEVWVLTRNQTNTHSIVPISKNLTIYYVPYKTDSKIFNVFYYWSPFFFILKILKLFIPRTVDMLEWNFFSLLAFSKLTKRKNFQLIHSESYQTPTLFISLFIKKIQLIIHIQSYQKLNKEYEKRSVDSAIQKCLELLFIRNKAIFLIACSKLMRNILLADFPEKSKKIHYIPNFIFPSEYSNRDNSNRNNIVFMGRFEHRKGIDILICAFAQLAKSNPNIHLHLIGESNAQLIIDGVPISFTEWFNTINIDQEIKKRVVIYPQIRDRNLLIEKLKKLKGIGVVPSRHEPFGFTNIEFMALGYILISTSGQGGSEIIDNTIDGYLIQLSEQNLYRQLKKIISLNKIKSAEISKKAVSKIVNSFSNRAVHKKYQLLYSTLKMGNA